MKIYCASCGIGAEYVSKKPNFCFSCGKSYDTLFKEVIGADDDIKTNKKKFKHRQYENDDPYLNDHFDREDDDGVDAEYYKHKKTNKFKKPSLSSVQFNVGRYMKISDLAAMGPDAKIERGNNLSLEELNKNKNSAIEVTRTNAGILNDLIKNTSSNEDFGNQQ